MVKQKKYFPEHIQKMIDRELALSQKKNTVGLTAAESVEWLGLCEDLSDYLDNTP